MEPIIKISGIKNRMKDKPPAQRLYDFFYGDTAILTKPQIKDIKKIAGKEHKKLMNFLDKALSEL